MKADQLYKPDEGDQVAASYILSGEVTGVGETDFSTFILWNSLRFVTCVSYII